MLVVVSSEPGIGIGHLPAELEVVVFLPDEVRVRQRVLVLREPLRIPMELPPRE